MKIHVKTEEDLYFKIKNGMTDFEIIIWPMSSKHYTYYFIKKKKSF